MFRSRRTSERRLLSVMLASLAGCSLTPVGTMEEVSRLREAGAPHEPPVEQRDLPALPPAPTWQDVLRRALLANGDLERAYFEWKAAVERIEGASRWPNSRVMLGYQHMFSGEAMKTFDRGTFTLGFDPMENLMWPSKTRAEGIIALDEARAAGARFRAAKFALQRQVLSTWAEFVFRGERVRIARERLDLARVAFDGVAARVRSGGTQQDLIRADVDIRNAESDLLTAQAELNTTRAMLNGMLARDADAPLEPPDVMPEPRPLPVDDAALLRAGVEQNPELEALAREVQGRSDALERARLEWFPDINPMAAFTGSVSQMLGATVMLPTTINRIESTIREAGAMLRASEAMLRQGRHDRASAFVATLVSLRNAERQEEFFKKHVIPATRHMEELARQTYAVGVSSYNEMTDARRMFLDARLMLAEARMLRETRLAELEALMGVDVETLAPPDARVRPPRIGFYSPAHADVETPCP
jgi:cobalt-zinc-cadmium efflux system outer membrane protein